MATEFQEHLTDLLDGHREVVELNYDDVDFDVNDTSPAVIILHTPTGEACVISPYVIPGDMTIDVALFDCVGDLVQRRLIAKAVR